MFHYYTTDTNTADNIIITYELSLMHGAIGVHWWIESYSTHQQNLWAGSVLAQQKLFKTQQYFVIFTME